jgi:NADH-quinone oxidoreductase subunit J
METILFYIVALIAVGSGLIVILSRSPVNSALGLVNTFFCLAVFYVMLYAPFMAAVQIMVYAGAIMVLILFVIMLLNLGSDAGKRFTHGVVWAAFASVLVLVNLLVFVKRGQVSGAQGDVTNAMVLDFGHTELIGKAMFTEFLLPFEIASILLLVAIVGAVILTKREV